MEARKRNGPLFMKTYSKKICKVDPWFSPDMRKAAFSFSSTLSSDQSIPEITQPKKRIRNGASRPAKSKGITDTKKKESDDENFAPPSKFRKKTKSKQPVSTTARKTRMTKKRKPNLQAVFSSSESEDDCHIIKNISPKPPAEKCVDPEVASNLSGKFVTRRKRPLAPVQTQKHVSKRVPVVLHRTSGSSDDFLTSFSKNKHRLDGKLVRMKKGDFKGPDTYRNRKSLQMRVALGEVSFNESDDQQLVTKHPLLSSTPSVVCRQLLHLPEPSISEISSLSFDELQQHMKNNQDDRGKPPTNHMGKQVIEKEREDESIVEVMVVDQKNDGGVHVTSAQTDTGSGNVLPSHVETSAEKLKERCRSVKAAVMVNKLNISDKQSMQSCNRNQAKKISSNCLDVSGITKSRNNKTNSPILSNSSSQSKLSLHPFNIFSSSKSFLSSPLNEERQTSSNMCSNQPLIDRIKAECLLSCLTVEIPRLNLSAFAHLGAAQALSTDSPYICQKDSASTLSLKENCNVTVKSPIRCNTETVVRRLSESFCPPPIAPPATVALSAARPPAVSKERTGAGTSTGRKVCVSGLNVSRWSRRGTGEHNVKRKKREGRTKTQSGNASSCGSMLSAGGETFTGESAYDWLQGTSGVALAVTPLKMYQMNLSSILANFTPDSLSTNTWGRLKASLSLHKKKTAFPTPKRLAQFGTPSSRFPADTSLDLFASPVGTPLSRYTPSRLLRSTMNSPMSPLDDDISDAEKVYQECQQNGPLSFNDCLPPPRMKVCSKIGEGTFGEVFSTINDSNQTVALKIIPVEGSQKVNGEHQKTFGEILHEIIISKELSSLNLKEVNKTNGFIQLNNLHCVRGRYPEALLKAWDKFDSQRGSENDRPDFFDDEQLFLILEFEFGGSDLENMKGKLSSMAQAKSILHQVTAALAVAEQSLCFEHRDLHWGNILVKNTKQKQSEFILNGAVHSIETRGVHVNIIDYSLSRLEIDGLTVSCDISADEELFMGQGDYQFEIYRLMKKENNNCWSTYNPHSNVLWLHYLVDKLLSMRYKSKAQSSQQKTLKSTLKSFQSEILNYASATEALTKCGLFQ